jgi:hypothetical protein
MANKPILLNEFKNWLSDQKDLGEFFNINRDKITGDENEKHVGNLCRSKVSERKLLERIETDEDAQELVREFLEEGATVVSIDGKKILLEVESGTFYLPRFCVKIRKSK